VPKKPPFARFIGVLDLVDEDRKEQTTDTVYSTWHDLEGNSYSRQQICQYRSEAR